MNMIIKTLWLCIIFSGVLMLLEIWNGWPYEAAKTLIIAMFAAFSLGLLKLMSEILKGKEAMREDKTN